MTAPNVPAGWERIDSDRWTDGERIVERRPDGYYLDAVGEEFGPFETFEEATHGSTLWTTSLR